MDFSQEQVYTLSEFLSVSSPQYDLWVLCSATLDWLEDPPSTQVKSPELFWLMWPRPGSTGKAKPLPDGEVRDPFLPYKMMALGENLSGQGRQKVKGGG